MDATVDAAVLNTYPATTNLELQWGPALLSAAIKDGTIIQSSCIVDSNEVPGPCRCCLSMN